MHRLLLPLIALLAAPAFAQPDLAGDWSGAVDLTSVQPDAGALTLVLHLTRDGDGYAATFDSPDQGAFGFPVDSVAFDGEAFGLFIPAMQVAYTATVDAEGTRIDGTWAQGSNDFPLVLTPHEAPTEAAARPKTAAKPGDFSGDWVGSMPLPEGGEVRVSFHLARNEDGTYEAAVTPPGQADRMDLGTITVQGQDLIIPILGQAEYAGTIADDERTAVGTLTQGGEKHPMTLTRQ